MLGNVNNLIFHASVHLFYRVDVDRVFIVFSRFIPVDFQTFINRLKSDAIVQKVWTIHSSRTSCHPTRFSRISASWWNAIAEHVSGANKTSNRPNRCATELGRYVTDVSEPSNLVKTARRIIIYDGDTSGYRPRSRRRFVCFRSLGKPVVFNVPITRRSRLRTDAYFMVWFVRVRSRRSFPRRVFLPRHCNYVHAT